MPRPVRMQVSRRAGFNLQDASHATYGLDRAAAQAKAVAMAGQWLHGTLDASLSPGDPPSCDIIRRELGGHNLACWCKPGTPCHADMLMN